MGIQDDIRGAAQSLTDWLVGAAGQTWRDHLHPAAFRGVKFETLDADLTGGRRAVIDELPQTDEGATLTEDLGLKAREFAVTGFVIGDGYMNDRDALIAALETPGPGLLVHPFRGDVNVQPLDYNVRESSAEGGLAAFTMHFVVVDVLTPTSIKLKTDTGLLGKVQAVLDAVSAEFTAIATTINMVGQPAFVVERAALSAKAQLERSVAEVKSAVSFAAKPFTDLIAVIDSAIGESDFPARAQTAIEGLADLIVYTALGANAGVRGAEDGATPSELAAQQMENAVASLFTRTYLAEAARQTTEFSFATQAAALAARDTLLDLLALEMGVDCSFSTYDALGDLREYAGDYLDELANKLPALRELPLAAMSSALELAQRHYADGSRFEELISLNDLQHPGFVPPGLLKVLSR